jgi:hypothetical protein
MEKGKEPEVAPKEKAYLTGGAELSKTETSAPPPVKREVPDSDDDDDDNDNDKLDDALLNDPILRIYPLADTIIT